jgi:valyl-tRNA synthetase
MRESVASGKIDILPERFEKIYFNWIDNLRDWNISRQLWYGHRIPVWIPAVLKPNDPHGDQYRVSIEDINDPDWVQDPDTLDTWFSSALWTFSTLGWPKKTKDLETFHPTSVMAPGYEILFFWVARMILMSTFLLGEIPFKTVYLHGIVRDIQGNKFSKSLDNGIDPVDLINKYGADALRMALMVGVGAGNDSKYDEMKVKGYRNFANKIWNAARFVYQNTEDLNPKSELLPEDQKILTELGNLVSDTTKLMDKYDLAHAAENLYHYFWHTFADKIIEDAKKTLADEKTKASTQLMLKTVLEANLKLLHPFMPFVTEAIWQMEHKDLLLIEQWPDKKS